MKSVRGTLANGEATPKAAMMKISNSNTNQISDSKKFNLSRCQQKKKKKSIANTTRISDSKKLDVSRCQQQKKKNKKSVHTCQEMDIAAHSQGSIFSQQDLMWEILSRLPVRSLLRFKCVAKSWDITSDPYFQMKHQRHHANSTKFLVVHCNLNRDDDFYSTSSLTSPDDVQKLDDLPPKSHILFGSCHGLFLIGVGSSNNQTLTEIPFPDQMCNRQPPNLGIKQCSLSVLEGMLCISSSWRRIDGVDTTFMLWAMKDYGVKESWIQLFKINFTGLDLAKSIYRFPDGDVLFDVYTSGEGGTIFDVTTFTESLISPKSLL
ncbi:hypothetical protein KY284_024184 [Solanum tuberosum]|nr:hypothetical protein KY284_024184 [Solanum tuberosum]